MNIPELALDVGASAGGFEPALEHGGRTRPLRPIAIRAVGGFDQRAQGAITEKAFDGSSILRADNRDKLLPFACFHGQVL